MNCSYFLEIPENFHWMMILETLEDLVHLVHSCLVSSLKCKPKVFSYDKILACRVLENELGPLLLSDAS